MQTGNSIPQANIQTPTAAGVSVNQYTHFNVDNRGAILNTSRRNVQTQLGGWIQGNPWLAGGEARVIVNQVNSADPSLLGGYIEVGGRRAEVVIANPAGIQVNGGGFINASRATLTTGQPQYQAGDLSGFKIRQGNVVIVGHGLDARDTDYTQILSRAVKIDAPVWGKDVRVLAGQNDVSADGSIQSSHSPAANTNSADSLYAIDTGALGGMYAGKITLISTDRDASVRNQGQWFASAGNVAVNAEGKLVNTGTIAATGENHAVSLRARNVRNSGTIASQDAVDIRSRGLDNRNGSVTAAGVLSVDSRNIDNRNGSLLSVNNTQLTVSDDLDNRYGEIATNRQLSIHDKNQNTLALNNADGTIQSAGNVSLQAKSLANNGTLTAGNKLDIALTDDFVVDRDLTAGNQLNLSTKGRLKNTHTLQAGHTLKLNAGNIDNQVTGKIIAGEQTDITSEQHVDNRGLINSNGLTRISAGQTLTNTGTGKIYGNHIALGAQKLLNREETAEGGTKAGVIAARERLDIGARETGNRNDALISSEGRLNIGGSLDGNNEASGRSSLLTNTGAKIEAGSDARISAGKLYNLNADFRVEDYIDSQRHLQSFYRNAEAVPFFTQDDGHHLKEDHDLNFYFKDGRHIHIHKYGVEGIWKADYTQTVYKQHIIADRPGEILIGGNLNAQGNWSNQNSRILVGLNLNSDGITNLATLMKVRTVNDGMMRRGSYDRHGSRGRRHIEFDKDIHPVVSPPIREGEIDRKEYEDGLKVRQRGKVLLNMIGAGLSAPTDSAAGIAAATASPALSYQIGQYFKGLAQENPDGRLTAGQETAHILAHGVLGAAVSAAGGNDALAGALASGGAEAAAPVIGRWLYGKGDGGSLSAEEKETVSAITRILGTAAGAAAGNSFADAVQGGMAADGAVTNNFVHRLDEFGKLYPEQDSPAHDRFNGYQALVSKGIIGIQDVPENTFSGLVEDSSYYKDIETGRRIERPDAEFYKQQFIEQLAKGEIVADDDLKTIAERTPEIASILNAHISLNKFNIPLIISSNDKQQKDVSPFIASLAHKNPWNTYYRATFDYRQRKVIRRVASGAKDAAINGILEIPFQAADFSSAGINVIFDTDLPVSRSIMGQKAKHGAGSGELIIDAGINAVSVYPPVAAGLASWGVGDSIANNNPEQLGSSLAGLGSSFVLAKTVGNPAYRIDWGGLPTTSSLKLQQMGSINPPRLTKIPANELDVKSYGEAKKGDVKGDNLEHDHIPSFAALVAANETILGRSLTASELRQLKNESTARRNRIFDCIGIGEHHFVSPISDLCQIILNTTSPAQNPCRCPTTRAFWDNGGNRGRWFCAWVCGRTEYLLGLFAGNAEEFQHKFAAAYGVIGGLADNFICTHLIEPENGAGYFGDHLK